MEYRWAEGHPDRLPGLAADLLRAHVDIIVTNDTAAAMAAKQATQTIPIVFSVGNAVEKGIVASLAHPGANLTGLSLQGVDLVHKPFSVLQGSRPDARPRGLPLRPCHQNPRDGRTDTIPRTRIQTGNPVGCPTRSDRRRASVRGVQAGYEWPDVRAFGRRSSSSTSNLRVRPAAQAANNSTLGFHVPARWVSHVLREPPSQQQSLPRSGCGQNSKGCQAWRLACGTAFAI